MTDSEQNLEKLLDDNKPETEEQVEDDAVVDQDDSSRHQQTSSSNKGPLIVAIIALCLTLAGLGVGYQHWVSIKSSLSHINDVLTKANKEQTNLKQQIASEAKKMAEQATKINRQEADLSQATSALETTRQEIISQLATTDEAINKMNARMGRSNKDWKAAEAAYLMRIANHRLQLEQDFRTATSALEAADEQLKQTLDPKYASVRETLAEEILSLQSVAPIDRVGIAAKLSAVTKSIGELKPNLLEKVEKESTEQASDGHTEKTWVTLKDDLVSGIKSALVIRRHDKPVNAMLTPQQYQLILESMRLQIEAARYAAIKGDSDLYQQSITNAQNWLTEYFDSEEAKTISLVLANIKTQKLTLPLPDISMSLAQLREIMAQREAQ